MVTYTHINHMCSLTCTLVELRSEPNIPVGNPLELIHLCRGREKTWQNKHYYFAAVIDATQNLIKNVNLFLPGYRNIIVLVVSPAFFPPRFLKRLF